MTSLEKSILSTLAYYDVLGRPLTGWEIFKYLIQSWGSSELLSHFSIAPHNNRLKDVLETLGKSPELNKLISQKNGLYFFKGRQKIVKQRIERQKMADQKWKKAKRLVKMLQVIPFIRSVIVSGSLAMNNTKNESDIDLLIITKAGRIWTCRGLITLFVHIIGQRRHGNLTKDRICLNHYLTDKSLKIPFKSLYNAHTYAHLVPLLDLLLDPKGLTLYKQFQRANKWIKDYLVFYPEEQNGYLKKIKPNQSFYFLREIREIILDKSIGNGVEFILKKFQQRRIKKDPLTYQAGGRVVFNDKQLEFHPDSPEKWILEKYNQEMEELGLIELANEKDSGLTV